MRSIVGYGELILQDASWAIDPVPVLHPIKRIEERHNHLQHAHPVFVGLAVPGLVEGPHGKLV